MSNGKNLFRQFYHIYLFWWWTSWKTGEAKGSLGNLWEFTFCKKVTFLQIPQHYSGSYVRTLIFWLLTAFFSSKFPCMKLKVKYQIIFAKSRARMKWSKYCATNSVPSEAKFPTVLISRTSVQRIMVKVEKKQHDCEIIIFLLCYNNVSLTFRFLKLNPCLLFNSRLTWLSL